MTTLNELKTLRQKLSECQKECEEQARLNGVGSEREARLLAQLEAVTMKQALEALNVYTWKAEHKRSPVDDQLANDAITNLRAAIKQLEERKPSVWINNSLCDTTFNQRIANQWKSQGHAVNAYYKD